MPILGRRSSENLSTCHPRIQDLVKELIKRRDVIVLEGARGEVLQNHYFEQGLSKKKWPESLHNTNPSRAVHIAPWFKGDTNVRWNDKEAFYRLAGYIERLADEMGIILRWGGDWNSDGNTHDQSFDDLAHWEYIGEAKIKTAGVNL